MNNNHDQQTQSPRNPVRLKSSRERKEVCVPYIGVRFRYRKRGGHASRLRRLYSDALRLDGRPLRDPDMEVRRDSYDHIAHSLT